MTSKQGTISTVSRRAFLRGTVHVATAGALLVHTAFAEERQWQALESYVDEVTGARLYVLAGGGSRNDKIYQTHPQWIDGMDYFVFHSDRSGGWRPHALEMASGRVVPVAPDGAGPVTIARKSDALYFFKDGAVWRAGVKGAFSGNDEHTRIASLPEDFAQSRGGISLDADETHLYAGAALAGTEDHALYVLNVESGTWDAVCGVDFQIGHVVANPSVPGRVMFCHETGGDAPQRMWLVNRETGSPETFYKETFNEWVTHETWWGPDRSVFTIWPYDDAHKELPHGIFTVTIDDRSGNQICEYPAWHTDGSPDGAWVMGDDFDRNIWLIEPETGGRRLLTQGHKGDGFNTHPHASFTPDSQGIVLNSSRSGNEDIVLVLIDDWDNLKPANESPTKQGA